MKQIRSWICPRCGLKEKDCRCVPAPDPVPIFTAGDGIKKGGRNGA